MRKSSSEKQKQLMAEEIWLSFFNNYLFKSNVITMDERIQMNNEIIKLINKKRK
jgi:hypothetical protein